MFYVQGGVLSKPIICRQIVLLQFFDSQRLTHADVEKSHQITDKTATNKSTSRMLYEDIIPTVFTMIKELGYTYFALSIFIDNYITKFKFLTSNVIAAH